jgi:hypothetical protein
MDGYLSSISGTGLSQKCALGNYGHFTADEGSKSIQLFTMDTMNSNELLSLIDAEIANLRRARSILAGVSSSPANAVPSGGAARPTKKDKKRKLTPEGRARIADAAKRRWTAQKAKQKTKS